MDCRRRRNPMVDFGTGQRVDWARGHKNICTCLATMYLSRVEVKAGIEDGTAEKEGAAAKAVAIAEALEEEIRMILPVAAHYEPRPEDADAPAQLSDFLRRRKERRRRADVK